MYPRLHGPGSAVRLIAGGKEAMGVFPVIALVALASALILLNVAVARFGYDSRDGDDWVNHRRH
ncbi:MAG: hypothetical protein ACRDJ1_09265 [Actinomycetota bacterium]